MPTADETAQQPAAAAPGALPAALLSLAMLLAPAMGARNEDMLQDTFKSIVVSFFTLAAAAVFFWQRRNSGEPVAWHAVVALPLLLMVYALASMGWSHEYLAAVEAVRWFIFAVLLWIGLNAFTLERLPWLAAGIHFGGAIASLWAVLQFLGEFALFPAGPPPSSTFINRNFFAEFAVCTLPFGAMLLARARKPAAVAALAASGGLVIVAVLMTGTRSALIALWLQLLVLLPLAAWRFRKALALSGWSISTCAGAALVLFGTVIGLGLLPSGNQEIIKEGRGANALERGLKRTGSISARDESLGVRMTMWAATLRMIEDRPLAGVGAGAWENDVPFYQAEGSQLETDYYVHNEYLQLIAEYGVAGWLFLLGLLTFLLEAARRTFLPATPVEEAAWRAAMLVSLGAFAIVSSIGFPWRMAATGALFALCLAGLAASDLRLGCRGVWSAAQVRWSPLASRVALGATAVALIAGAHISLLAAESERDLVRATQIAMRISHSANPSDPRWDADKREVFSLVMDGIAINPHYRKITPIVADEAARWGDWRNATWIWESVLRSRPHVVAIIANVARGYAVMGDYAKARAWLAKARAIQPGAPAIRSLEVVMLARQGDEARALALVREGIAANRYDFDLVNAGFTLALRAGDHELAKQAMLRRIRGWPSSAAAGYVQLGNMYSAGVRDTGQAMQNFERAKSLASPAEWEKLAEQIPVEYRARLGLPAAAAPAPQISASKG